MMIGLSALVERYLTERRTLGFQLRSTAYWRPTITLSAQRQLT